MTNYAMQEKLKSGEAISVLVIGKRLENDLYLLNSFFDDVDYCDPELEAWIWSIGRNYKTGEILASRDSRFYQNPDFECLFLR